ncbi:FixH family protein [uncultured Chitinophaga sp.]|jgi:FixH.|uniref:FixH family protein n=1 Tax=uncultured Chitinophaga sp. TaxID=339340 RepID=UPI002614B8A2|nr:FixH family protein [uncultured Chitinophaga sp.]
MNWGYRVIIIFTLFAAGMLTLVIKSMRTRIDMVTPDYYGAELQYQEVIDGRENSARLSAPVTVKQAGALVELSFPEELKGHSLAGKALFYRPADAEKDMSVPLQLNEEGKLLVDSRRFAAGPYQVKIQWEMDGKPYFHESSLWIRNY